MLKNLIFLLVFSSGCFSQGMSVDNQDRSEKKSSSVIGTLIPSYKSSKEMVLGGILEGALENIHFAKKKLDDDLSEKAFKLYLERLDYGKQFLLEDDVEKLEKFKSKMDDQFKSGQLQIVDLASSLFKKRLKEVEKIFEKIMNKGFNFEKKEEFETDSEKREFADSSKELEDRWRKTLKFATVNKYLELKELQAELKEDDKKSKDKKGDQDKKSKSAKAENLEKQKNDDEKKRNKSLEDEVKSLDDKGLRKLALSKIKKRYERVLKRLSEEREDDQLDKFYNSVARVYDPHTHYFIPEQKEDFDIDMTGKLEGIGALLREDGQYIKVERIIPGSASWKGKELKEEDIILAVGQEGEELVDIVDMSIRDAVKMIRGPKGTKVILSVRKPDKTTKVIEIVRDEVVLEEAYVKGALLKVKDKSYGYIKVPKFYRDFEDPSGRNCSEDVKKELLKFQKQKNLQGVILDLRSNGGGALQDARIMAGHFIKKGPIVQVKSSNQSSEVHADDDPNIYYNGPLIVLVNRFSASASEIVAAALQDYKRALVVGTSEQTHGKGTVQMVMDLDRYVGPMAKKYSPLGALKITIQMFYRVTGGSTQFKGVIPDIVLPDPYGYMETGEQSLDYAIDYNEIPQVEFKPVKLGFDLEKVKKASLERVKKNEGFQKTLSSNEWFKKRKDDTIRDISLTGIQKDRDLAEKKSKEFEYKHTIDGLKVEVLSSQKKSVDKEKNKEFEELLMEDIVLEEVLAIFDDMKEHAI